MNEGIADKRHAARTIPALAGRPSVRTTGRRALAAACAACLSGTMEGASFTGLGFLPDTQASYARGVSADGVVVGESIDFTVPGGAEGFRWKAGEGMTGLGFLPGADVSLARAISSDGTVIVGMGVFEESSYWGIRWSAAGVENLGWTFDLPRAVSADGAVAVGTGATETESQACRWTAATGRVLLGVLPGGRISDGNGVSADGGVVVGTSQSALGERAFRWTAAEGMVSLGVLPGLDASEGDGISADGSTIVGASFNGLGSEAFRWTQAGGLESLGRLPSGERATALAASGDGAVIVGYGGGGALVWDENHGLRILQEVLARRYGLDLSGWELQDALAISPDARFVVGSGTRAGMTQAWMAQVEDLTLPELSLAAVAGELTVSWPAPSPGWKLESTDSLQPRAVWSEVPGPYQMNGTATVSFTGPVPETKRFYRLVRN